MTDLADEIYEATGMILGTQQAAAMTAFVRTREAAARHEAADEIERLWAALRHLSDIALEREAAARREGIEAAEKVALGERITKDSKYARLLIDEPYWSGGYNAGCDDCAASIRALLTEGG